MTEPQSAALRWGLCALLALLALQILWHVLWFPLQRAALAPGLALAVVPLLPGLWICLHNLRRGVLIGGIACLFYFCHGIAVAFVDAHARWPALGEVALTLAVIAMLGWDARHYKRAPKPPER